MTADQSATAGSGTPARSRRTDPARGARAAGGGGGAIAAGGGVVGRRITSELNLAQRISAAGQVVSVSSETGHGNASESRGEQSAVPCVAHGEADSSAAPTAPATLSMAEKIQDPNPARAPSGYWEARVSVDLGIARARLRDLREQHLKPKTHFQICRGAVVLTPAGFARIKELVGLGVCTPPAPEIEANGFSAKPPERATLLVALVPKNPRLLVCRRETGAPADQIVKVRSNENFIAGMRIEVVANSNCWQVFGRLPRRRGKW